MISEYIRLFPSERNSHIEKRMDQGGQRLVITLVGNNCRRGIVQLEIGQGKFSRSFVFFFSLSLSLHVASIKTSTTNITTTTTIILFFTNTVLNYSLALPSTTDEVLD